MITLSPHCKVYLCVDSVDFRKGIDGLQALCRLVLKQNPTSQSVFVFRNRRASALKLLSYDGQGWWLCQKRLSQGRFTWWPRSDSSSYELSARHLSILLSNGDPFAAKIPSDWRSLSGSSDSTQRSRMMPG